MTHPAIKKVLEEGLEKAWSALLANPALQVEFLRWLSDRFHRLWGGNPRMIAIAGYMKRAADDMEIRQPVHRGEQEFLQEELEAENVDIEMGETE